MEPQLIALKPSSGPRTSSRFFNRPICPELNAIERLWQHLKRQWKGENFDSLAALRQRVEQVLTHLSAAPVQSLTSFDFILDALLQAAF